MWIVLLVFVAVILWDFCEVFFQCLICIQSRTQCYGRSKKERQEKRKKERKKETEIKEEESKQAKSGLEKAYHLVKESTL